MIYGLLFVNSVVLAVIFRYVMSLLVCWLLYSLWFVVLVFVVCFCGGVCLVGCCYLGVAGLVCLFGGADIASVALGDELCCIWFCWFWLVVFVSLFWVSWCLGSHFGDICCACCVVLICFDAG